MICTIDYIEKSIEAERRLRRGERQLYCCECGKWRWAEECEHAGRLTAREFHRAYRGGNGNAL